jgi:O-antigen/teichoic acid export membrane protein
MSLRAQFFRGGAYLAVRQLLSLGISLVGVVLLTRLMGPTDYGRYAGSIAIVVFLVLVGRLGVDAYVIRRPEPIGPQLYGLAFATMAVSGVVLATTTVVLAPLVLDRLVDPGFVRPLQGLALVLPLSLVLAPALATLDRTLDYRSVALLELGNAAIFYVVAVALAALDFGVWAPVAGHWAGQVFMLAGSLRLARLDVAMPRSLAGLGEMLRYGLGFMTSSWVHDLRTLVNPLVVGGALGPAAVGYVSLALRVAELVGFARAAGYRLSLSALTKVAGETERLRRALGEAMVLQTLAVGPFLVAAAVAGPWAYERAPGPEWAPVGEIFPFVALAYLLGASLGMERSLLYVVGDNRSAFVFSALYVALLAGAAVVLVRALDDPRGYGIAEVVALAAYAVVHVAVTRVVPVGYRGIVPWLVAFAPPLFVVFVPLELAPLLFVPLVAVLLWPAQRRTIRGYLGDLRASASAPS